MRPITSGFVFLLLPPVTPSVQQVSAPQSPALVAGASAADDSVLGKSYSIESAILGETRRIRLTLPASFARSAPERRYPVTVIVDGEELPGPVAAASEHLARMGQVPESILVGIENFGGAGGMTPDEKRVFDLTPPGLSVSGSDRKQGGDRFLDFVERELLPAVERQFRGGLPRAFVGHSSGGVLATWVAATRPGFRVVVAIDTPTWFQEYWLVQRLMERAKDRPGELRYASLEARFGWRDGDWQALVAAAPPSWRLFRQELEHETHESMALLAAYLGLREVYADYAMLAAPEAPTTGILPYYEAVGASLGASVVPPAKLLRNVVVDLNMEGRGAAAREAYELLASGYGAPEDAAELLARIAETEKRPPPTETVESLLATPFPTPDEARAFLGEWAGDVWMNEDEPRTKRQLLRLREVDGRVQAEVVSRPAPGEEFVREITYLAVTKEGLTYGFLNGMRPRGVVLFEGKLEGDTLSGTNRFGGVDVRGKDGDGPPPLHFAFTRVPR